MKSVPLGPVLATIHDRLVCPFDDYREFLNHVTGTDVPLWDVARARREASDHIRKQYPLLMEHKPPEKTDNGTASRYVRAVAAKVGYEQMTVRPLAKGKFKARTGSEALK